MAVFNEPTQWDHELGNNADVSTLPDDTGATTGVASLQKLFQIINQTPLEAGGVAPSREDFNALFKYLGDQIFYTQNGGVPSYNADYDYIAGRVVLYNGNIYKCIQANGASSTVVAPDSVSPLGSDYWVQVATLADFTNFANTDLSNLSASGQAIIDGKADKDFSNVSTPVQAFKDMSIGWGMPNYSSGIDIGSNFATLGGSWTAPSDGFVLGTVYSGSSYLFLYLAPNSNVGDISNAYMRLSGAATDISLTCVAPIKKGQTIYQTSQSPYVFSASKGRVTFYPCKGV